MMPTAFAGGGNLQILSIFSPIYSRREIRVCIAPVPDYKYTSDWARIIGYWNYRVPFEAGILSQLLPAQSSVRLMAADNPTNVPPHPSQLRRRRRKRCHPVPFIERGTRGGSASSSRQRDGRLPLAATMIHRSGPDHYRDLGPIQLPLGYDRLREGIGGNHRRVWLWCRGGPPAGRFADQAGQRPVQDR